MLTLPVHRRPAASFGEHRPLCRLALVGVGLAFLAAGSPRAQAADGQLDPHRLRWSRLEYKASKFTLTARSSIDLDVVPFDQAVTDLADAPGHDPVPMRPPSGFKSMLTTTMLGRTSTRTLWFDPRSGAALQNTILETGKRKRRKIIRYARTGAFVVRINPMDKTEDDLPPADWSKISKVFYPYDAQGEWAVCDAEVLFYMLSVIEPSRLEAGFSFVVYADDQILRVDLKTEQAETFKVDYVVESDGNEQRRKGRVDVTVVSVRGKALASSSTDSKLEILGLRGDIDIFLDPQSRLPLGITGKIPYAGRVTVRLQRAVLGESRL